MLFLSIMTKRSRTSSASSMSNAAKKSRSIASFNPRKVATFENAARVDERPPLVQLERALVEGSPNPGKGECVVYWMRMQDLRIRDNRALSKASAVAQKDNLPLIVLSVFSPQDYKAHDRGARRIDFMLRNLAVIKRELDKLDIPLYTFTHTPRKTLPSRIVEELNTLGAHHLFANIEYEVDELRRDIQVCSLAKEKNIKPVFLHDRCVIEPGVVKTKENRAYAVYSPYQRQWIQILNNNLGYYLEDCAEPKANPESIRHIKKFARLFDAPIPADIPGFELEQRDKETMEKVFPAGEDAAAKVLERFLTTKSRSPQLGPVSPLSDGAETSTKHTRILDYHESRDRGDMDTTSRISPYLASGVISARACVRGTMELAKLKKVDAGRNTGIGRWVQEVAWRDFYNNVLAGFPRVSMGRPFLEKYAYIKWEYALKEGYEDKAEGRKGEPTEGVGVEEGEGVGEEAAREMFEKWKAGMTGVPIVDASMRCIKEMGWLHNRMRMIVAMFLTKQLMIDWRLGERYFMENLIDGDLAANNGGWQWSASTGVDPAPYFRIFNPYSQSTKADPSGDFIRRFVPELKKLKGQDLHNPSKETARAVGYPLPIIDHAFGRERAMRRYKNPGDE